MMFVGLSEYVTTHDSLKTATSFTVLVWAKGLDDKKEDKKVLSQLQDNPDIYFYKLAGPFGQKLVFPDARVTINTIKNAKSPEDLSAFMDGTLKKIPWFQMEPRIGPLWEPPLWAIRTHKGESLALIDKPQSL